jgi:hypothetical protein
MKTVRPTRRDHRARTPRVEQVGGRPCASIVDALFRRFKFRLISINISASVRAATVGTWLPTTTFQRPTWCFNSQFRPGPRRSSRDGLPSPWRRWNAFLVVVQLGVLTCNRYHWLQYNGSWREEYGSKYLPSSLRPRAFAKPDAALAWFQY